MGARKPREERIAILIRARMRGANEWCDVTICNYSSRGLMLRCMSAPPRGTIVEVRHRCECIIGRVVWSHGNRCGVRTRDPINLSSQAAASPGGPRRRGEERRNLSHRASHSGDRSRLIEKAYASRRFARAFDWWIIAIGVVYGAVLLADLVSTVFNTPMEELRQTLNEADA